MSALNNQLRARANALFAQAETLKSSELAIHTRIAKPRLQMMLDGVTPGTLDEWDRIFAYFKVNPLEPSPQELNEIYGQFVDACGTKHRYMSINCDLRQGHQGTHAAGGFEWANNDAGPSLADRVLELERTMDNIKLLPTRMTKLEDWARALKKSLRQLGQQ